MVYPVILAGGAGTRLWPLSREDKPKQFHDLTGNGTLFEETVRRLKPIRPGATVVVTGDRYADLTREELKRMKHKGAVLTEPMPRNTAPAILFAATYLEKLGHDSVMIVLPADHHIQKKDVFVATIRKAIETARRDSLVTIGIKPTYPETGYGYIKAQKGSGEVLGIDRFVEKPNVETAQQYLDEGNYFWNSGIFIWKTSVILRWFERLMPECYERFAPLRKLTAQKLLSRDPKVAAIKKRVFSSIEPVSIDYGIMERAENRAVIPSQFGWADLGSWQSIDDILPHDAKKNRTPERSGAIFIDSENCSVVSENLRVALIGLSNVFVVQDGDNILVMDKAASQDVRKVVDVIKKKKR
ncbi:MAG TPA: mannose-1-phosphate guanylyltransferase [Spirochaetota bacterium]|mgnify:CR=1 FL=1|nr:mannose-1-phosphate guanylyltransferase [Spirochaetota bacterium]HOS40922.1 mannose-1-phosphate guanylyltransferase [Spirochaetota bacterium]HPI23266.1 mannose-1-phosphate guanylyltransferase [Spirochaetota bacterium]HPU88119.1 mannose-1-phosphate guanylyltransferase [Spirochaetota bacterium]